MRVTTSYRNRIYARYTSEKMQAFLGYTEADYRQWAEACRWRIRGWLPADRGARCLDIGCGPGNMLFVLKEAGYRNLTGVDVSPEQVEVARRIWSQVECADVMDYLERHESEFALITAIDLIEHFRKDEVLELLARIQHALRPGGTVIIQTPNAESPWGSMHRYHDFTHEVGFDPHSLEHVLRVSGFGGFEARECGPYLHGVMSAARVAIWKGIRAGLLLWNLAETGGVGSGVYTRVFIARAGKPTA